MAFSNRSRFMGSGEIRSFANHQRIVGYLLILFEEKFWYFLKLILIATRIKAPQDGDQVLEYLTHEEIPVRPGRMCRFFR
jgi:hypothetical protein